MRRCGMFGGAVLLTAITCLLVSGPARAQQLYAAVGTNVGGGRLYRLDDTNGAVIQDVGALQDAAGNVYGITGLAFHPTTNVLFGATSRRSTTDPFSLVVVNPSNAQVTVIGAFGIGAGAGRPTMADITFIGGTLYGWSEGPVGNTDDLYTINLATGAATLVGESGLSTSGSGLAADTGGNMYLAGDDANGFLNTIVPGTGLPSSALDMDGGNESIPALTFHKGLLYGLEHPSNFVRLVTINTVTGHVTRLGRTVDNLDAIASTSAAPEPGTLALLGLGMTGAFLARRSRRQG